MEFYLQRAESTLYAKGRLQLWRIHARLLNQQVFVQRAAGKCACVCYHRGQNEEGADSGGSFGRHDGRCEETSRVKRFDVFEIKTKFIVELFIGIIKIIIKIII